MKITALVLALLLVGCTSDGWDDVPAAPVTAHAPAEELADWAFEVSEAVDAWRLALPAECEPPFVIAEGGHPIVLVPRAEWRYGDRVIGMTHSDGFAERGHIEIRGELVGNWPHAILLHELGHALGLDHFDDTDSIMNPRVHVEAIDEHTAIAAACRLGCGPCT